MKISINLIETKPNNETESFCSEFKISHYSNTRSAVLKVYTHYN